MSFPNAITGHVRGRVQGVGFRYFAKSRAEELGLSGWVKNLPDGTVQFMAKGDEIGLERFMQYLRIGPPGSRVDGLVFQRHTESGEFEGFEIRG